MQLYIINETGTRNYKIGIANDVDSRLSSLKTGNPRKLHVIGEFSCKNAKRLEGQLHKEFSLCRVRGEWFNMNAYTLRYCLLIVMEATKDYKLNYSTQVFMSNYQLGVYKIIPAVFFIAFSSLNFMAYESGMVLPFLFTIPLIGMFFWFLYNFFWLKTNRNAFYGLISKVFKYNADVIKDIRAFIPKRKRYYEMENELSRLKIKSEDNRVIYVPNNKGKKYKVKKSLTTREEIVEKFYAIKKDNGDSPNCSEVSRDVKYSYATVHRHLTKEGLI